MQSIIKSETGRTYALFIIVLLSAAFGNMSQTALNTMMPSIIDEMGVSVGVGQWLTTIYMLIFGITVPLVTFLSRRFSLKSLIYISSAFSLAGLLLSMFTWSFGSFFVGRVLQAVSVGILLPIMQTIAMVRFPANKQGMAMGVAGIAMGVAPTAGPTLGGFMDEQFGWRSFFVFLFVAALILLILTTFLINREDAPDKRAYLDMTSFFLSSLGFGALLLGLTNASTFFIGDALVWAPLVVGIVCLILFVRRQLKVENPLINMGIFSSKKYVNGFTVLNTTFAAHLGVMLILALFIQGPLGGNAFDAGIILLPGVFVAIIVTPLSGILTDRVGVRPVSLVAGALFLVGSVWMVFVDETTSLTTITMQQTVRFMGLSALVAPLTSWCLGDLPRNIVTDGSSFMLAVRQAASSLATAIMVLIFVVVVGAGMSSLLGYQLGFLFSAVLAVVAFAIIVVRVK